MALSGDAAFHLVENILVETNRVCKKRDEQCCPMIRGVWVGDCVADNFDDDQISPKSIRDVAREDAIPKRIAKLVEAVSVTFNLPKDFRTIGRGICNSKVS